MLRGPATRLTDPSTCASVGRPLPGLVARSTVRFHAAARRAARSVQACGAFQRASAASRSSRPLRASATSGTAPCLAASKAPTLSWTRVRRGLANAAREPVVKSASRVPMASTTSASAASALAALDPVTPIAPTLAAWSQARLPLPACVSATGMPRRAAKSPSRRSASAYLTPPPATISGRFAPLSASVAASSCTRSGRGRWRRCTRGRKNAAGNS